ncbi:hypothetical protein E7744_15045 (plasmid) [Citricoccus sp. SGAir0253]|uniref:hypothetical protein n=1 Tax=Citricoccus sp. SGAir0253 TaxID=2567881 RepID=UPI0010CCCB82|nr:hypothetical protein [Citricoccus sp. SGAir0253]QCU79629.1 hypothetical protein E7744_15045 [Citricoccus sp. SGAir0253]
MKRTMRTIASLAFAGALVAGAAAPAEAYYVRKIINYGGNTYSACETARKNMVASINAGPTTWVIDSKPCYRSKHVSSIGTITYGYSYGIVYGYR